MPKDKLAKIQFATETTVSFADFCIKLATTVGNVIIAIAKIIGIIHAWLILIGKDHFVAVHHAVA